MLEKLNLSATLPEIASPAPFYRRQSFLVPFCIIVLSLIPKLLIIPIVFHSDLISVAWSSRTLAIGDWDIYDTGLRLWVQYGNWNLVVSPISHGPLFFYPYGAWLWLVGLLGLFPTQRWGAPDPSVLTVLNYFILKLPALLADLASAFFISRIFEGNKRNLALGLWLFAPMTLYFTYATGQDDIFMITCICASLYFAARALKKARQQYEAGLPQPFFQKEAALAVALLGVGVGIKLFTIFFIPILVIILSKQAGRTLWQDYRRVGVLLGFSLLPVVLVFAPLALLSKVFLNSVLLSSETSLLGNLVFYDGLGAIVWFWLLYFMLIAYLLYDASQHPDHQYNFYSTVTCMAVVTFIFLITCNYPAQFMIWSLPLLVIMITQQPRLLVNYLILTACEIMVLLTVFTNNLDPNALWATHDFSTLSSGSVGEFISKFIPITQVATIIGPLALLNLVAIVLLYRRSITEPLFESWRLFRNHAIEEASPISPPRRLRLVFMISTPLIFFACLVGILYFLSVSSSGLRLVAQEKSDSPSVAVFLPGTEVRQDFVAPAGQLERVELMFNTSDRLNLSKVDFTLYQTGIAAPVMKTQIDAFYVRMNVYYPVKLPQVLELTQTTHFYFTLSSSDATVRSGLATSNTDLSKLNPVMKGLIPAAQINGVNTNQVLQFRVDYGIDWGHRWLLLWNFFGRTPFFSILYLGFCLLLGILFVSGLLLQRVNRPKVVLDADS